MTNRYALSEKIRASRTVSKEHFIQEACRNKTVLDLGCIRHSAEFALKDPDWLHNKIRSVAGKTVGVDYLPAEVEKLAALGYTIVLGDVTRPLPIEDTFDVIVAGDLIEHLTNFEGFFENCTRLLKAGGVVIVTTPNPFYADEFFFVAGKRSYLINPEHTCWIDPQALSQLAERFGYSLSDICFLKQSWHLKDLICENEQNSYDILRGTWRLDSFTHKVFRKLASLAFGIFYTPWRIISCANTALVKHSDYLAVLTRQLP